MSTEERAWRFDGEVQTRSAGRVERFEGGVALYAPDLPRVYDANLVRVDSADGLDAERAEALAESLQGDLAHRKLLVRGSPAATALADDLRLRGWYASRTVVMEYRGPRDPVLHGAARAEQVDPRAVRGARYETLAERGEDVQRQVADFTERLAAACDSRTFAAFAGGEIAAYCVLLAEGGVGEIDEVTTVERHRRQGLGTAVVEAALSASLASGHDLTFLVAQADDWPRSWYERLGFEVAAERWEVWRTSSNLSRA